MELKEYVEYCRDFIIDNIRDFEGEETPAEDFGARMCAGPHMDGSLTYSRYDAEKYIIHWWGECGDYMEYLKEAFGSECVINPFNETEKFMVSMVCDGVNQLLYKSFDMLEIEGGDHVEITPELIEKILLDLDSFDIRF